MAIFQHILSLIIWVPIIIGLLIILINRKNFSYLALVTGLFNFIASILILEKFDPIIATWQFTESYPWFKELGIYYNLGVDGFSVLLIILAAIVNLAVLITSSQSSKNRSRYMACFLIANGIANGVFAATNAVLFYMFFEAIFVPLFLIIGIWGREQRIYAAIKFLLYTSLGSILFLIAIIYLFNIAINNGFILEHALEIKNLYLLNLSLKQQTWLFIIFFIAFAVKIPMVPFHSWLPDAHSQASTEGSVMLAAILLKLGAFAMLRFLLPITSDACLLFSKFAILLSLITIIYIGFIAIRQKDFKKLIAYSSISSMGYITLGLFIAINLIKQKNTAQAIISINGSFIHMIAHGLIVAALFFSGGVLYKKTYSYNLDHLGGIVNKMPKFGRFFMVFCLANMAMPATIGFVGEFLIVLASCKVNYLIAATAAAGLILSACYMLSCYKKVMLGAAISTHVKFLKDLDRHEILVLGSITVVIIWLGVAPKPIFNIINSSTLALIKAIS